MKLISLCIIIITLNFSNSIFAFNDKNIKDELVVAPLSGTYYIPADFVSINDAAIALNTNGISGPVTFNVAANHVETAPVGTSALITGGITFGVISGTSTTNTITFQKNGIGSNPLVYAGSNQFAGSIMNPIIKIIGADYLTFDGIDVSENPLNTNSTIATNNMTEFGYAFFYANTAATADGSQNNAIKNCNVTLNTGGTNYQNTFGIYSTTLTTSTNGLTASSITSIAGSNSYNIVIGNSITNANYGIVTIGSNTPAAMDIGWEISYSTIVNFAIGNGVASSLYQKLGTTVQGILVNQIADAIISYNTISSTNGSTTTTIPMIGILLGWSGAIVQPPTNTTSCHDNNITINNALSENTYGIWSRTGDSTSSKTFENNVINLQNTSTIAVAGKFMKGIFQDILIGELQINNNTITLSYDNVDHAHNVYFIQADVAIANNRQVTDNTLTTAVGKTLRTSGIVIGISHNGLTSGILNISSNIITINKGNVISTNLFSGIYCNSASSSNGIYAISSNTIQLNNSATSGSTIISGIYNKDNISILNKNISSNSIAITGINSTGTTYGIFIRNSSYTEINLNEININNFSPSLIGIQLDTLCTTNNLDNNQINISPVGIPANATIIGINSTSGTSTITNSTIFIEPVINPTIATTITIQGINNSVANCIIGTNPTIIIRPTSTSTLFTVNLTSNGILNSGVSTTISDNLVSIFSESASGATNSNGINNSADSCSILYNRTDLVLTATTATTVQGILNSGTNTLIQYNGTLNVVLNSVANGIVYGITNSATNVNIIDNQDIQLTQTTSSGISRIYGINNTALSTNIHRNNTFHINATSTLSSTVVRGISSTVITSIKDNTYLLINSTAYTTSTTIGIFGTGEISGNSLIVTSNAKTGIVTSSGIQSNSNTLVDNNTITSNFNTDEGDIAAYGIYSINDGSTISNNIINHSAINNGNLATLTWNAQISGILCNGNNQIIDNNKIESVYASMGLGTTSFETAGIILNQAANTMVSNNIISNVSTNGTADNRTYLCGIYALTNSFDATIKNNRIFNISFNNNVTGVHPGPGFATGLPLPALTNGIWIRMSMNTVVNNYKIYNNHISKLYNPSASNLGGIYGLLLSTKEVNHTIYHNTISIGDHNNMIVSNMVNDFGASAVGYLNRVGTGLTDLRNNILYVNAMPKGNGFVAALSAVKSHDLDLTAFFTNPGQTGIRPPNYSTTSNNNSFYAPSVHGRHSYFYCEGDGFGSEYNRFNIDHNTVAINDPNMNVSPFSGCTSKYKTLMNGGSNNYGTDSNSFYENIVLSEGTGINEGYLTPIGETYAEMGAQILGGQYDLDSVNISRSSVPDMGAIQFSGTTATPPSISYSSITISCGAIVTTATLNNVHIVDSAGIPTIGSLIPRLYYKVNLGTYTSVTGVLTSGTTTDGYWSFTLTGLAAGTISYYIIAQDNLTKIISNPSAGLVACNVNSITTHPTTPNILTIGGGTIATYQSGAWSSPPLISSVVIFDDNYNSTVNIEACSVLVKAGRTVIFNSANTLLIQNELVVEPGGTLIFENNSSLVQVSNSAINSGTIIYKRETLLRELDNTYWSAPVSLSTSPYLGFDVNSISLTQTPNRIDSWIPDLPNSNSCEGDWVSYSGPMSLGKGYALMAPNTFLPSTYSTFFGTFNGIPNNGIINTPIARGNYQGVIYTSSNGSQVSNASDNYNLLGNPYPSAISASQFLYDNRNKLEGNISLWTHGNLPVYSQSPFYANFDYNYTDADYYTYNFTGTSCCPAASDDLFISAGQGFFAEMKDGAAGTDTVEFNNGMRNILHDNSIFYRTSQESNPLINIERNRIWLDINSPSNNSERTLVGYIEGATNENDSFFDYEALLSDYLSIYTISNSENFLIQGKSLPFDINDRIPVGFYAPEQGSYNIAIGGLDGLFSTQNIYLEDKLLHIIHNLKIDPYSFEITNAGNYNDRFDIIFINNSLNLPDFEKNNEIILFKSYNKINIKSTITPIDQIKIFDIGGRLLYCQNKINQNEVILSELKENNEFLLVEIVTTDKIKTNKKIIF